MKINKRIFKLRKINRFFINLNFKQKLLLSYFLLIIVPLGILTTVSSQKSTTIIEENLKTSARQVLEQASSILSHKISNITQVSDMIFSNTDIREILSRRELTYSVTQQMEDLHRLENILVNVQVNRDIFRVKLYVRGGRIYSNQNVNVFNLGNANSESWFKEVIENSGKIVLSSPRSVDYLGQSSQNVISATRVILDINMPDDIGGIVSIDTLQAQTKEIVDKANLSPNGATCLLNAKNEIISFTGDEQYRELVINEKKSWDFKNSNFGWRQIKLKGKSYLFGAVTIDNTDWTLVSMIPQEEILRSSVDYRNYIFILMVIIGALAYGTAYYISYYNTKRIRNVIKIMRKVEAGGFDINIRVDSTDEIGELQESFKFMVQRIVKLLEERYDFGVAVKNSELKALQAQINPHFLYNTLDMIYWMADVHGAQDVKQMVNTLAKFYKLSLNKGNDVILIKEEIMLAKAYFDIQNKRYEDKIILELDIDEEINSYVTQKIILQPLIENSIMHGIMAKKDKSGTIKISGRMNEGDIILSVEDDGVGIEKEKLERIMIDSISKHGSGYGVKNINERLKLCYGECYGLKYESTLGLGTKVIIRLPAVASRM